VKRIILTGHCFSLDAFGLTKAPKPAQTDG
jgi:hypothetical protein